MITGAPGVTAKGARGSSLGLSTGAPGVTAKGARGSSLGRTSDELTCYGKGIWPVLPLPLTTSTFSIEMGMTPPHPH